MNYSLTPVNDTVKRIPIHSKYVHSPPRMANPPKCLIFRPADSAHDDRKFVPSIDMCSYEEFVSYARISVEHHTMHLQMHMTTFTTAFPLLIFSTCLQISSNIILITHTKVMMNEPNAMEPTCITIL